MGKKRAKSDETVLDTEMELTMKKDNDLIETSEQHTNVGADVNLGDENVNATSEVVDDSDLESIQVVDDSVMEPKKVAEPIMNVAEAAVAEAIIVEGNEEDNFNVENQQVETVEDEDAILVKDFFGKRYTFYKVFKAVKLPVKILIVVILILWILSFLGGLGYFTTDDFESSVKEVVRVISPTYNSNGVDSTGVNGSGSGNTVTTIESLTPERLLEIVNSMSSSERATLSSTLGITYDTLMEILNQGDIDLLTMLISNLNEEQILKITEMLGISLDELYNHIYAINARLSELENEDESLAREMSDKVLELQTLITEVNDLLRELIDGNTEDIDSVIKELAEKTTELSNLVDEKDSTMKEYVDKLVSDINDIIKKLEGKTTDDIKTLKEELSKVLEESEKTLGDSVTDLYNEYNTFVTETFEDYKTETTNNFNTYKDETNTNLTNLESKLTQNISTMETNFGDKLTLLTQQFNEYTETTNKTIKDNNDTITNNFNEYKETTNQTITNNYNTLNDKLPEYKWDGDSLTITIPQEAISSGN